jgi:hypothetical protein
VKCGVFFAVRTELLNIIWTSFGYKGSVCFKDIVPNVRERQREARSQETRVGMSRHETEIDVTKKVKKSPDDIWVRGISFEFQNPEYSTVKSGMLFI